MLIKLQNNISPPAYMWFNVDHIVTVNPGNVSGYNATVTTSLVASPSGGNQINVVETPDAIATLVNALKQSISMSGTVSGTVSLQGG